MMRPATAGVVDGGSKGWRWSDWRCRQERQETRGLEPCDRQGEQELLEPCADTTADWRGLGGRRRPSTAGVMANGGVAWGGGAGGEQVGWHSVASRHGLDHAAAKGRRQAAAGSRGAVASAAKAKGPTAGRLLGKN